MHARDRTCYAGLLGMAAAVLLAACDSPSEPGSRVPAQLLLVRGDTQTAAAGQRVADSVEVRVLNRRGEALGGVEVEFAGTQGGGTLSPRRVRTDASGSARAAWTLGTRAGAQTAQARVRGRAVTAVVFTARATAGLAARVVAVSGNGQSGRVGEALAQPLVVRVTDAYGNGVAGRPVAWSAAGGQLVPAAERTDTSGLARATWTLGTVAGIQANAAHASVDGDSAHFDAVAVPGPAVRIGILPDSLVMVHPARFRMEAAAYDAYGNRIWSASAFSWSVSNLALAAVEPDPVSSHVTVTTRAPGQLRVHASATGLTDGMWLGIAAATGHFHVDSIGGQSLNNLGEVAFFSAPSRVGVWRDGRIRYYDLPPVPQDEGALNYATAINDAGVVVVFRGSKTAPWVGYDDAGWFQVVNAGAVSGGDGLGLDINAHGQVVGSGHYYGAERSKGFLWDAGRMDFLTDADVPGWNTSAVANNDRGQVAINVVPQPPPWCLDELLPGCVHYVYLWDAGRYTLIPRPALCKSWQGVDLNNAGHLLLNCGGSYPNVGAFLWDGSALISLSPIIQARGLNDRGEVVGAGVGADYVWRKSQSPERLPFWLHHLARINASGQILSNGVLYTPAKGGDDCTRSCVPRF